MSDPAQRLRNRASGSSLTVDYADVLAQAVDNEKWRIIRDVVRILDEVATDKPKGDFSYLRENRCAKEYKEAVLAKVNAL